MHSIVSDLLLHVIKKLTALVKYRIIRFFFSTILTIMANYYFLKKPL